jgi:hypothetical protein
VDVWHALHAAAVDVGMWLAGLSTPVNTVVLVWQAEQSPVVGCAGSAMAYVLAVAFGRVWKPVYWPLAVSTVGEIG